MQDHELRRRAVGEMHLRRWPQLPVPCLILQWVLMVADGERAAELAAIEARAEAGPSSENPSHREGRLGDGIRFAWERHSEGTSLTIFSRHSGPEALRNPAAADAALQEALAWATSLPGKIVRATCIWLAPDDRAIEQILPDLDLIPDELVSCRIGGAIRMWSDFRYKDDGFGRLLVAANGADTRDLTRRLQALQELGNYRNRALIGLPLARECWPQLDAAERQLRELAVRVAGSDERDDALMDALSGLSLELGAIAASISFRMDATRAYAQLVEERLAQLDEMAIPGFQSLTEFTQRRFRPAMNTCTATTERVRELTSRAAQLSSLLRARIETRIENQNAQLLHSMERSASMQLRLQQLVEGLSVVALSYYLIGLIAYLLKGLPHVSSGLSPEQTVSALVLPVVAVVWLTTNRLKKRLLKE